MTRSARPASPKLITIALAASAAAALLAGAQPAAAKVVTETVSVPKLGQVSATATCPKGQRATGGGLESTPGSPNNVQVVPRESRKIGQRSWTVTAVHNSPAPQPVATMTAIAYCLKKEIAPKTKEAVAIGTSAANYDDFTIVDAVCPDGRTVQAGGFSAPTPVPSFTPFSDHIDSFRVAEGIWRARIIGDRGAQVASYAYCAKRKPPTEEVGTVQVGPGNQVNVSAISPPCADKRKAISGGFAQPDATPNRYTFAFWALIRVGKAWQTSGVHFGSPTLLNSYVYCMKKPEDGDKK